MFKPTSAPLTDDEIVRLADFLENAPMNLEMMDGFFSALICSPEPVPFDEIYTEVWGEEPEFENEEQAQDIITLVMRHWNTIAQTLLESLSKEDELYFPVIMEIDGEMKGNDWAQGFMQGVSMDWEAWQELLEDEEYGGSLVPMMILEHEHDPNPESRPPPEWLQDRMKLLQFLTLGLAGIYRYFEPYRLDYAEYSRQAPIRNYKPGRNEPCFCGSGRKYKHCCLH